jgi:hypothetical protein
VGGVADYTNILSQRLVEVSDGAVEPVLVHAGNQAAEAIEVEFPVVDLSGECSATGLSETIEQLADEVTGSAVVLLEYSGYGYAKRGAPLWLVRGLRQICGSDGIHLVTMFHELYATGPPWTSTFWLSPIQAWCTHRIAVLSDGIMVTYAAGAETLENAVSNAPIETCPVFSNVGEPEERPSFAERDPVATIFGGRRTKQALYESRRGDTRVALERWGIEKVVDIGPPDAANPDALETNVEVWGIQQATTISRLLSTARIGLLRYSGAYATKSGILAAFMSHGVVPVLVEPKPMDGPLEAGIHFATAQSETENYAEEGSRISSAAADWYDAHAHSRNAANAVLGLADLDHLQDSFSPVG